MDMKKSTSTDSGTGTAKSAPVHALRTGKIYVTPGSASEIRRSVGVRPSEAKVAERALRAATTGKLKIKIKVSEKRTSNSAENKS
jgi:hypothetical protein